MRSTIHPNEEDRLTALRSYEVLDTDPEIAFDDIAQLAARLCEAPVAMVNLVDRDRQFSKSSIGLDIREMPVSNAICAHALLVEDFLEIHDTLEDPRTRENPICCGGPNIRYYAGALLKTSDGLPLGALCVLDHVPRRLTPVQRDALRVLANQVMTQLDLRRALTAADTLRQEVDHRVKNSLQTLSAFVTLKTRNIEEPEAMTVLTDVSQRIQTVSLLHDLLHKTEPGAYIDLGLYLGNVVDFLAGVAPEGVSVTSQRISIEVDSRTAAGVGTLVNEIAANAFKHAFPDGRTGTVDFQLDLDEKGRIVLIGSDDGAGLAEGQSNASGLGMKLIRLITEQLGGSVTQNAGVEAGLSYQFLLPTHIAI